MKILLFGLSLIFATLANAAQPFLFGLSGLVPPDVTAPTLTSATIPSAGNVVNYVFNEAVTIGAGGNGGLAVATLSGGAATLTYLSGSGTTTLVYSLSRTVVSSETGGTTSYTQPGNGIEDIAGNDKTSFSTVSVTNSSSQSGGGFTPPGSPAFTELFNATGYDNTLWGVAADGATIDPDYTPAPLEGAQSLRIVGANFAGPVVYRDLSNTSETTHVFSMRWTSRPSADLAMFRMTNAVGTGILYVQLDAAGTITVTDGVAVSATTVSTVATNTTYYVWVYFKQGSGSNSIASVGFSSSGTRPTSGNSFAGLTNGQQTDTVGGVNFRNGSGSSNAGTVIYDQFYVTNP